MPALHIVNRRSALDRCVEVAAPDDTIVLIEDGVYAAASSSGRSIKFLEADARARGLGELLAEGSSAASSIDYHEFVALTTRHQPIVSWR